MGSNNKTQGTYRTLYGLIEIKFIIWMRISNSYNIKIFSKNIYKAYCFIFMLLMWKLRSFISLSNGSIYTTKLN